MVEENLKAKTVKGVVWSTVERFSTIGVAWIFGLLLARLLTPSDYGTIALLTVFTAVAGVFIDSGFSTALIRKIDRTETDKSTVFYFNIAVSVICYAILYVAAPYIAAFYDTPVLTSITRVLGLTLIIGSLGGIHSAMLSIALDFKTQAKISLSAAIVSGCVGLYFAYTGWGVWALVIQQMVTCPFKLLLLFYYVRWRPTERFSLASFRELFSFGSKLLASALLDTLYNNIYPIVIGKKFSPAALGLFSRAEHLAQFPSSNITGIMQRVTFPVLSLIQNEDERLAVNYRKFLRMSGFLIFPLMLLLAALADPLIRFLLTDKWEGAILFLQIICLSMMWYPIHAINLNLLQVKGRSDLFLRLEVIKKILGVSILCVTIPMGLVAMCWGRVFSSIVCLAINTHYTGKLIHIGFFRQMKDLMPTLINSFSMGALVYFVQLEVPGNFWKLLVGSCVGVGYYILSNLLFKTTEWKELMLILKRK